MCKIKFVMCKIKLNALCLQTNEGNAFCHICVGLKLLVMDGILPRRVSGKDHFHSCNRNDEGMVIAEDEVVC
jgi:hypothetical protein